MGMKPWEFKDQYDKYFDQMKVGDSVRAWHCKSEGSKGNDAFIITKTVEGYKYYCHHCHEKGIYKPTRFDSRHRTWSGSTTPQGSSHKPVKMPSDSDPDMSNWPSKYRVWLWKYLVSDEEVKKYGICYSHFFDRVIFPIISGSGVLLSWTGRSLGKEPKYLHRGSRLAGIWRSNHHPVDYSNLIIVEDIVSGIRCGRYADTIALLGTSLPECDLNHVVRYKKVDIYLDNDNSTVKANQLKLLKRIGMYTEAKVHHLSKDPKEYDDERLRKILCVST